MPWGQGTALYSTFPGEGVLPYLVQMDGSCHKICLAMSKELFTLIWISRLFSAPGDFWMFAVIIAGQICCGLVLMTLKSSTEDPWIVSYRWKEVEAFFTIASDLVFILRPGHRCSEGNMEERYEVCTTKGPM